MLAIFHLMGDGLVLRTNTLYAHAEYNQGGWGGGGGDLVPTMPGCVCPKVKDMGPFLAPRESNE